MKGSLITPEYFKLFLQPVLLFDKTGKIIFSNKSFERQFGLIQNLFNYFSLDFPMDWDQELPKKVTIEHHFSSNDLVINSYNEDYFIGIFNSSENKINESNLSNAYYTIGNLTKSTKNLEELLERIHLFLIERIQANNMLVCIDDKATNSLDFIYYVDEEVGGKKTAYRRPKAKGLPEYVLNNKDAYLLFEEDIERLTQSGEIEPFGMIPKIWIGVPLIYNGEYFGVITVKSFSDKNKFNNNDLDFLKFISTQISFGIERKSYEDRITEQTARLQSIFESGNHLIWSVNKKRQLTSFNENYSKVIEKIYNIKPTIEEDKILLLSDKQFTDLISDKYNLAFQGNPQQYETSFVENDDSITWRQMFLSPIYNSDGTISQISGIAHDITDKKLSELKIIENEKKFRNIFESLQDIYIKINGRDEIELVSPSVQFISGFRPEEMTGLNVRNFIEIKKHGDLDFLKNIILQDKSVKNFELSIVTKNGERIPCIANLNAVLNNHNKVIGLQGVIRDIYELQNITEELKKAKIEAEDLLKVKENFLANMSHEIRTPMNGIVALIDMLQETELDQEQKDYVVTIQQSSRILLKILNDILDLSKLDAGKMDLKLDPLKIKDVIQKVYLLFSQQALQRNIDFSIVIDEDIPEYLLTDETRLIQVLLNLTSNAIKFTDSNGKVEIRTEIKSQNDDFYQIQFQVKDTGIGLGSQEVKQLFQSFNQIDKSITKKYGGTGLGLSISKRLVQLMGGEIEVESRKGFGSTFSFKLELQKTKLKDTEKLIPKRHNVLNLNHLKFLIVDDNEVNRKVCKLILEKENVQISMASNGEEALEMMMNNKFDVVLMDIQMPVMDGVTAFEKIKSLKLNLKTKIIALTAYALESDRTKYLNLGFDNYLQKPVTREGILKAIFDMQPTENHSIKIDKSQKEKLIELGGEDFYEEMLQDFYNESKEDVQQLSKWLENKDYESIHQFSHKIKGSSSSLGLEKIKQLATKIEQSTSVKNSILNASLLEDFMIEYDKFVLWLVKSEKK